MKNESNNQLNYKAVGLYIRANCKEEIEKQRKLLKSYCERNKILNVFEYIDEGKSGLDENRKGLQKMKQDLKDGNINTIIIRDLSRLFRNVIGLDNFFKEDFMKNIRVVCLDNTMQMQVKDDEILQDELEN